jgi:hypothetical protein
MSQIIQMTGSAMAVLIGVILMIAFWITPIGVGYKILIALLGAILCFLGVYLSN